jgi:hypothetical protein
MQLDPFLPDGDVALSVTGEQAERRSRCSNVAPETTVLHSFNTVCSLSDLIHYLNGAFLPEVLMPVQPGPPMRVSRLTDGTGASRCPADTGRFAARPARSGCEPSSPAA